MSNPDVPGIEACKGLANRMSLPDSGEECWWWVESLYDEPRLTYCCHGDKLPTHIYTRAPTLGEMLAEIRRRGWQVSLSTVDYGSAEHRFKATVWQADKGECASRRIILGHAVSDLPADALANALTEAIEKEKA